MSACDQLLISAEIGMGEKKKTKILTFLEFVFKWGEGNSDINYEHVRW